MNWLVCDINKGIAVIFVLALFILCALLKLETNFQVLNWQGPSPIMDNSRGKYLIIHVFMFTSCRTQVCTTMIGYHVGYTQKVLVCLYPLLYSYH